jgi:hypothetical protein
MPVEVVTVSVRCEVDALIDDLGELSPAGRVLAETARVLAGFIDHPPFDQAGQPKPPGGSANALRACLADLVAKGRADADDDADADGWADIAASAGATPIRHEAEPRSRDSRARGRGGRSTAG